MDSYQGLFDLVPKALASVNQAVEDGKSMLDEELRTAESLPTSPEWIALGEKEREEAVFVQNERVNHAKRNLRLAEKAAARLNKRAQTLNIRVG